MGSCRRRWEDSLAGNQRLYVVTDSDGLDDANGKTQFLDLGPANEALKGYDRRRHTSVPFMTFATVCARGPVAPMGCGLAV